MSAEGMWIVEVGRMQAIAERPETGEDEEDGRSSK
jgi:hypothetical protein